MRQIDWTADTSSMFVLIRMFVVAGGSLPRESDLAYRCLADRLLQREFRFLITETEPIIMLELRGVFGLAQGVRNSHEVDQPKRDSEIVITG